MTFVLILHFDWLQGPHIGQNFEKHSKIFFSETTGVIQLIPPVLSSETLLHILLSSEYSGFRPSTTVVVIIGAPISVPTGPTDRR